MRRDPAGRGGPVAGWCDRLAVATAQRSERTQVERLAVTPLLALAEAREASDELHDLAQRTLPLARGAARRPICRSCFEHGDLGHPNLMVGDDGRLGVLDFEAAEPAGLPGHDLAFACAYAATVSARHPDPALAAQAFHGRDPWAAPVLAAHLRRLGIAPEHDAALLAVACGRVVAQAVAEGRARRPRRPRRRCPPSGAVAQHARVARWPAGSGRTRPAVAA